MAGAPVLLQNGEACQGCVSDASRAAGGWSKAEKQELQVTMLPKTRWTEGIGSLPSTSSLLHPEKRGNSSA